MTNLEIIEAARSWKETPWLDLGRSRLGVDCGGFLIVVFRDLGIIPETWDKTFEPSSHYEGLHTSLLEFCDEIAIDQPLEIGDIVTYSYANNISAHCGFISEAEGGGLNLIHAYPSVEKVCEHGLTAKFAKRIHRIFRVKGVEIVV